MPADEKKKNGSPGEASWKVVVLVLEMVHCPEQDVQPGSMAAPRRKCQMPVHQRSIYFVYIVYSHIY